MRVHRHFSNGRFSMERCHHDGDCPQDHDEIDEADFREYLAHVDQDQEWQDFIYSLELKEHADAH